MDKFIDDKKQAIKELDDEITILTGNRRDLKNKLALFRKDNRKELNKLYQRQKYQDRVKITKVKTKVKPKVKPKVKKVKKKTKVKKSIISEIMDDTISETENVKPGQIKSENESDSD